MLPDEHQRVSGASAPAQALESCIGRLASIIESETQMLKEGGRLEFDALNARKAHALLEFVLASRSARPGETALLGESVRRLQESLAENKELLETRLRATQEIAQLILAGIRTEESDGTYTVRSLGTAER